MKATNSTSRPKKHYGGSIQHQQQLAPGTTEPAYEQLAGYGFARRFVGGKVVADVGWEGVGYGSRLLAETAESVTAFTNSVEAVDLASAAYPAQNVSYERARLPKLPHPEDHFDVLVAFGVIENLERPEQLIREARRVLKEDGVLVVSVPDKQARPGGPASGGNHRQGMYAPELRELLEQFYRHVRTYRQGAVAGGFILPEDDISGALVEGVSPALAGPYVSTKPPEADVVLAVCCQSEIPEYAGQPYLLLDRERRIFDEYRDCAEDVELLENEVRRMQETEVQAFHDSYRLFMTEVAHLRAQIRARMKEEARLRKAETRLREMENSATWRLFEPYRRVRALLNQASVLRGRNR